MEWKEVRLGDVCEIKGGKRLPKGVNLITQKNSHPYIRVRDLGKSKTIELNSSYEYVDEITQKQIQRYITQKGDILISIVGTIGLIAIVGGSLDGANLTENCVKLVKLDKIDSEYLYYYLKSPFGQQNISRGTVGAVQAKLPIKNIQDFSIICPELISDQRRIASILSSLDRKIELNNKINADLEEMAQAIFKNWFVDFEPFKDGKFVDSELGMIPEGWKVGCLGDLITIKYGKDHKKLDDGTFPVYGSGGFMRFVNSWLYNGESVLIPRKGTLDNIMYVCEKFWTVDTMFFSVPKMDYVMKYVYNYIKRFDFSKMNEGTSVPSNTAARLNKMPILIPTHEILEMYDETLCPVYNKRKMKDKESRTLSLLRDTLLPRLMSGELEVPQ